MAFAFHHRKQRTKVADTLLTAGALALLVVAPPTAIGTTAAKSAPATLGVAASVNANCAISTSAVSFGRYESLQSNATALLNAAGSLSIACTKGSTPKISLDLGRNASGDRRRMALAGGSDALYYELYLPADPLPGTGCRFPGGAVWGPSPAQTFVPGPPSTRAPRTYSVCGTISPGQGVSMGSYADTIIATVNF